MPTVKELRLRVKSLKNTRKITAAMKMVSAAKLKRAKESSLRSQPYINKLNEVLGRITRSLETLDNPLLAKREPKKTLYVVFSSDRGLCGAFNNNLLKFYFQNSGKSTLPSEVVVIGKKAHDVLSRKNVSIHAYFSDIAAKPNIEHAKKLAGDLIRKYLNGDFDKVVLIYNQFRSTISQKPVSVQLLPVFQEKVESEPISDYIFEPSKTEILDHLLPKQIALQIFQSLLDNAAGEHAARMTAMDNATKNASDLIHSLTILMNRARQAAITKELIEIVSGAESLNN